MSSVALVALAAFGSMLVFKPAKPKKQSRDTLPQSVIARISGFTPYYFKTSFETDFTLQDNSVQFQRGVLVFNMQGPAGQTLAFTEEATPPGFDISSLQADKHLTSQYGQEFITDAPLRTTGALFADDHTWVLVNAPMPVGADVMQQIIGALQPVGH